jgi:glycosyltransferase involved in cell wall biosynthesis
MLVFILGLSLIVYVLAGYPTGVALLARFRARPIRKSLELLSVTVLLPVRNGEPWIREKLDSILALDYPRELVQILVICDGCEDGTERIVAEFSGRGVELVSIPASGKAAALNEGLKRARGEILFFTDVRQALDNGSLRNLIACLGDPTVGAASGELVIRDGRTREEADTGLYWRYEKWIRRNLSRIDSIPGATGCIYAMRARFARPLAPGTILDDVDLPLNAFFQGYRVVLDDSARAYDYPASLQHEFRRKMRTQAGIYQLLREHPRLLGPANRMWFHFVSHKLGRLALPWALLAVACSSFTLPGYWAPAAIAAQVGFYGLAAADRLLPEGWVVRRVSSPARTFVVLMAATFCAAVILVRPRKSLWRETRIGAGAAGSAS